MPIQGTATTETSDSCVKSVTLPFASITFSDSYHLALLQNLGVDGGLAVFSRPVDTFYISSAIGLPAILPSTEVEVASFCKLIEKNLVKINGNVLQIQSVGNNLPKMSRLADKSEFPYLRVYRIKDFWAAHGYWFMFFKELENAQSVGKLISHSLSFPQFHDWTAKQIYQSPKEVPTDEIILRWVTLLNKRDKETVEHTTRVAELAIHLARGLGLQDEALQNFYRGALIHDVGKIVIPDEILLKPGALTESEWKIMRLHPRIVTDLLRNFNIPDQVFEIPIAHHEKWDGSGYPHGLKGEEIPLSARIFAVVDVWDAMRTDRPYRKKFPPCQVIDYIKKQKSKHFDPRVADAFLNMIDFAENWRTGQPESEQASLLI
jgi:putative nucleotidyltransferase with HDIG domain